MRTTFPQALRLTLAYEGGYVNHPADPGGPTNKGITQKVYDAFRVVRGYPKRSVKEITNEEIDAIYRRNYWQTIKGDDLPAGVDYAVFDFAVNSGVSRAVKFLQNICGVTADGVIGVQTLAAVKLKAAQDEQKLILDYCLARMKFLRSLGTFATFGKGWTRRVVGNLDGAQENDIGVVDYACKIALKDTEFVKVLPVAIGERIGEKPAKAVPQTLVELQAENDLLASKIC